MGLTALSKHLREYGAATAKNAATRKREHFAYFHNVEDTIREAADEQCESINFYTQKLKSRQVFGALVLTLLGSAAGLHLIWNHQAVCSTVALLAVSGALMYAELTDQLKWVSMKRLVAHTALLVMFGSGLYLFTQQALQLSAFISASAIAFIGLELLTKGSLYGLAAGLEFLEIGMRHIDNVLGHGVKGALDLTANTLDFISGEDTSEVSLGLTAITG